MIDYKNYKDSDIAIYLNFPFCHHACPYCHYIENLRFGYTSIPDEYFLLLTTQLNSICSKIENKKIDSIYFGGGTASLLTDKQLEIIASIFEEYQITSEEVSIEIHPAYCNFDYVNNLFFTRYSIGVQSFDEKTKKSYRRMNYKNENILNIVESCKNSKKINIDIVFSENIQIEEINFIEKLQPTTFTCYPNTKERGENRLLNILATLETVEKSLVSYNRLGKSPFIFVKKSEQPSRYAVLEYEKLGNIFGVGHNSISYVGDKSYLTLYENQTFFVKERTQYSSRYLHSIFEGLQSGVRKSVLEKFLPDLLNHHFLFSISNNFDISEKHQRIKNEELIYIPVSEYIRFSEYAFEKYPEYVNSFLCTIGYGDSNFETIRHVYNSYLLLNKEELDQLSRLITRNRPLRKIKTPNLYVLVEGIDGSGKDTFVQYLCAELKKRFIYKQGESMISITGQPNTAFAYGKYAKEFVENISYTGSISDVVNALSVNRIESEIYLKSLNGIKILIRGIATDKATLEQVFGKNDFDLGVGKVIQKFHYFIVVDVEPEVADVRIEKRGIPRTWREQKEYLSYFRKFYLNFNSEFFNSKIIIKNDSFSNLKKAAVNLAEEIYANEFNR
ncbi:MAG: radical SAM protein [Treponema sp.]|uniref:radical SAM protein n=1 Tax=Treponema sp. TaxID=166 RepID=UPI003FA1E406